MRIFAGLAVVVAFFACYPLSAFAGSPGQAHPTADQRAAAPEGAMVHEAWEASSCGTCQSHLALPGKTEAWAADALAPVPTGAAALLSMPAPARPGPAALFHGAFAPPSHGPLFRQAVLLRL